MGVTLFTFILFPLSLIWILQPVRLLQLVIAAAIFEAAAAFSIDNQGVQPALVPAGIFLCFVLLQFLLGAEFPGYAYVRRMVRPFLFVMLWALVSSYVMPRVFAGKALVWPPRMTPPFIITPLNPSATSLNQDIYLIINTTMLVLAATFLSQSRIPLKSILNVYLASGLLAGLIAIWQLATKVTGFPFPDSLFYSNPGWSILTEQRVGAVPRINGSFSEPSSLGSYMAAAVCSSGWLILQGHREILIRVLFLSGLAGVMLSTSTTGFAVLAAAAGLLLIIALISNSQRLVTTIGKIALPIAFLGGLLAFAANALSPDLVVDVEQVFTATLNKQDSASYQERTSADFDSMKVMLDTYGLGAGWGTNRSSSLVPGLLAGIGIPGLLGCVWFTLALTVEVRRARKLCLPDQMTVIDGCCGALIGILFSALISGPTINSLTFFVLLALLIGCLARVQMDAFARRIRTPQPLARN